MAPVITIENLESSYGDTLVLCGIDLLVGTGEVVCSLDPNGVGKTTPVENLPGPLPPTVDRVRALDTDPRRASTDFWARAGPVQQSQTNRVKWRVRDQLEWIRSVQLTAVKRMSSVDEVLDVVDLSEKADFRLPRFSDGQRRTTDFVVVPMVMLELLVLDEPTTGLDPVSKARLHDLILAWVDDDAIIVMTTHDPAEAEHLTSRVLIMNEGRILADGTVTALREHLDRGAGITWVRDGMHHVYSTHCPECFVKELDFDAISVLTITCPTLEETYLSFVSKEVHS